MNLPMSRAEIDTRYPVSPLGEPYGVLPEPFIPELQRRLTEIGKQDVGIL